MGNTTKLNGLYGLVCDTTKTDEDDVYMIREVLCISSNSSSRVSRHCPGIGLHQRPQTPTTTGIHTRNSFPRQMIQRWNTGQLTARHL